ncbi:hypothetical protein A6F56_04425 [Prescottella equi]|nr:hypothetical protein A6F56_04425 [Prescottella equi]
MALTATPDFELTLEEQCEAIWAATEARQAAMDAIRAKPPLIRLWDGNRKLQFLIQNDDGFKFEDPDNETGPGEITLDFETPQAQWLNDMYGRKQRGEKIDVLISIDHCGGRWSGLLDRTIVEEDESGYTRLIARFHSDYEQLKWLQFWSSPMWPAAIQKRLFLLGGPLPWVILTSIFVNLWRKEGNLWHLPDDPLKLSSWLAGPKPLDQSNWSIVVKPLSFMDALASGAPMTLMSSRWKTAHEACADTLADGEYSLTWRRWFEGDPEPWPGAAGKIAHGALVIGCEDKSGVYEGTANGGTWMDGFTRTIRRFSDDLYEDTETAQSTAPVIGDYRIPGRLNTNRRAPYVFFHPKSPGVKFGSFTQSPAKGKVINTGGHSMPGVNETLSAAVQGIFDIIGNLFQIGSIGGSVDAIAKMFYEDTILAWISVKLLDRARDAGWFGYFEYFIDSGGKAYTLSSIMVIRSGRWATRSWSSSSMEIADGAPYLVGDQGQGHFWKGDRVSRLIKGDKSRRLYIDRVSKLTLSGGRGQRAGYTIEVGNGEAQMDPVVRLMQIAEKAKATAKELGVF